MNLFLKRLRCFRQLLRQQWLSPEQMSALRRRRLRRLVRHAGRCVPYYRRMFAQLGMRPEDIRDEGDFRRLPLLKKTDITAHGLRPFLSEGYDPARTTTVMTSGSSGRPMTFIRTPEEEALGHLTYPRALMANGVRPWHRQVVIMPANRLSDAKSPLGALKRRWKLFLEAGPASDRQIEVLRAFRPSVIRGYNGNLQMLAAAIEERGITDIRPRFVFGTAELLDAGARERINRAFGVEMRDLYGCSEAHCVAWECPAGEGYHINADTVLVEFLRHGRPVAPGEPGRVVITPLHVFAMPLLRYEIGDIGIPLAGRCACGRGLPMMKMIQGRSDDFVTLPSGFVVPPVGTFADVFEARPDVAEFFLLQEKKDLIRVRIVPRGRLQPDTLDRLQRDIEALTRHEAVVEIVVVDRLERPPGGKIRRIASRVPVSL